MKTLKAFLFVLPALAMVVAQDYNAQMTDLKNIINNNLGNGKSIKALLKLNQVYHLANKTEDALVYYNSLEESNRGKEIEAAAVCVSAPILLNQDLPDTVRAKCLYVKDNFKGTHWAAESLYNLGELYLNAYLKPDSANIYFRELTETCPFSSLAENAELYLGGK